MELSTWLLVHASWVKKTGEVLKVKERHLSVKNSFLGEILVNSDWVKFHPLQIYLQVSNNLAFFSVWHFSFRSLGLWLKSWHLLLYLSSSSIALQDFLVKCDWKRTSNQNQVLSFHQSTFPFVLKLIVFKCCWSVDFFITSSIPSFLQLLGRNVNSLKACELTFCFRSKDLNICISPSLAVLRTGSNVNFTHTASHWSKCSNRVNFFPIEKHFWIDRAEYLNIPI